MKWETAAQGFAAMGSKARLTILRTLVRAGADGLTVGEIQDRTGIAPSTLAHHLKFMAEGGLIEQEKIGRAVINRVHFANLEQLATFVLAECCAEERQKAANDG